MLKSVALSWSVEAYKEFRLTVGGMEVWSCSLKVYGCSHTFFELHFPAKEWMSLDS